MLTPPVEKDRTGNLRVQEEGFLREVLIDSFLFCMFFFGDISEENHTRDCNQVDNYRLQSYAFIDFNYYF